MASFLLATLGAVVSDVEKRSLRFFMMNVPLAATLKTLYQANARRLALRISCSSVMKAVISIKMTADQKMA